MDTIIDTTTLQPGDAFQILVDNGPQGEVIFWGRIGTDMVVTWAARGLPPFTEAEGPKTHSEPWLLTPRLVQGAGHMEGRRWTSRDGQAGFILARSGAYQARDEASNSPAIMAAQHMQKAEYLPGAGTLGVAEAAEYLMVAPATIPAYRRDDPTFPKPDVMLGRSPRWRPATLDAWKASRPGRGAGGGRPRKAWQR